MSGPSQSGAPETDSRPVSKADHRSTYSSVFDVASAGNWSGRGVTSSPRDVGARISQGHLKLIPGPCRKPTMGAPIRRCSTRHSLGINPVGGCHILVLGIPSCGCTHQEGHFVAVRPVRRSGVTRLAAPGELPFLGCPAFPLYLSARGGVENSGGRCCARRSVCWWGRT